MKKVWSYAKTKRERRKLYLSLIPEIRKVARESGYAIGVHGSLTRDLDLMAMRWTDKAVKAETLAVRIHKAICKHPNSAKMLRKQTQLKPHGRVAYALILGFNAAYIDLSIM